MSNGRVYDASLDHDGVAVARDDDDSLSAADIDTVLLMLHTARGGTDDGGGYLASTLLDGLVNEGLVFNRSGRLLRKADDLGMAFQQCDGRGRERIDKEIHLCVCSMEYPCCV